MIFSRTKTPEFLNEPKELSAEACRVKQRLLHIKQFFFDGITNIFQAISLIIDMGDSFGLPKTEKKYLKKLRSFYKKKMKKKELEKDVVSALLLPLVQGDKTKGMEKNFMIKLVDKIFKATKNRNREENAKLLDKISLEMKTVSGIGQEFREGFIRLVREYHYLTNGSVIL